MINSFDSRCLTSSELSLPLNQEQLQKKMNAEIYSGIKQVVSFYTPSKAISYCGHTIPQSHNLLQFVTYLFNDKLYKGFGINKKTFQPNSENDNQLQCCDVIYFTKHLDQIHFEQNAWQRWLPFSVSSENLLERKKRQSCLMKKIKDLAQKKLAAWNYESFQVFNSSSENTSLDFSEEDRMRLDAIILFYKKDPALSIKSDEKLLKVSDFEFDAENSTTYLSDEDSEYFEDLPKKITEMNLEKHEEVIKQVQLKDSSSFDKFKDKFAPLAQEIKQPLQVKENCFSTAAYINTAILVSNISYAIFPHPFLFGLNVLLRFSGIMAAVYHKKHATGISGLINLIAMLNLKNGWTMTPIDLFSVGFLHYHYKILNNDTHTIIPEKKFSDSIPAKAV